MVQLGGLEPPTSCSTDRRSNQLSYNCILARPEKRRRTGRKLGATPGFGKAERVRLDAVSAKSRARLTRAFCRPKRCGAVPIKSDARGYGSPPPVRNCALGGDDGGEWGWVLLPIDSAKKKKPGPGARALPNHKTLPRSGGRLDQLRRAGLDRPRLMSPFANYQAAILRDRRCGRV